MINLLFLTYADKKYEQFAIPYVWFALINNPDSFVEIKLEDEIGFRARYKDALVVLSNYFENQYAFTQSVFSTNEVIPNTIRFLEEPSVQAKYIYIGDIDLLVFDDVLGVHTSFIDKYSLPFSNIVRDPFAEKPRLSGLHFCSFENYYPKPDLSDLDLKNENDEHVLYLYMIRKGFSPDPLFRERPECGIHLSLNRDPAGRTTGPNAGEFNARKSLAWGGSQYWLKFKQQIADKRFAELLSHLNVEFKFILLCLESIANDKFDELHWLSLNHSIDKRLLLSKSEYSLAQFNTERDFLIKNKNFGQAESLTREAVIIWPNNVDVLRKLSWILMSNNKISESVAVLNRIICLPGGLTFLKSWDFVRKNQKNISSIGLDGEILVKRVLD
ncbi:tetratricopeptide repeat protein [Rheinheimera mangrovi]|uniref:tetratricopeptide repeat protein n=1 Tax=Rheinheimera mangrovi TaxID=2498451 RepID=UPI000F8DFB1E|nr:tetratricopeptide repeat protein [Rheinheimera mangrovi]